MKNLFVDIIDEEEGFMAMLLGEVKYVNPLCVIKFLINDKEIIEILEVEKVRYNCKFDKKIFSALGYEMNPVNLVCGIKLFNQQTPDSKYHELTAELYQAYIAKYENQSAGRLIG